MIFIEWISSKEHRSFNESLLETLRIRNALLFSFAPVMQVEGQRNVVLEGANGRLARAMKVFGICWRHRRESIFLLTYDALMFPVLQLFCPRLYVYEHNTTPEGKLYRKHAVWQRLFFRRVTRFAQFPAQHETLRRIGQKSRYLGSPLPQKVKLSRPSPCLYVAPSDRIEKDELLKLAPLIGNSEVVIRNFRFSADELTQVRRRMNVTPVNYIDTDHYLPMTKAIVIAIASSVRGSGWFNEAIRFGIPLIIINKGLQRVFEETFPDYPYVALDRIESPAQLDAELDQLSTFDARQYIAAHNSRLKAVYDSVLDDGDPSGEPESREWE